MRHEKAERTRASRKRAPDPMPETPADAPVVADAVPEAPAVPPESDAAAEPAPDGLFRRRRPPSPAF